MGRAYGPDFLPLSHSLPGVYFRGAILVMLGGWAIFAGLHRLRDLAAANWPVARYSFTARVPAGLDSNLHTVNALSNTITYNVFAIFSIFLELVFAARHLC